MTNPETTKVYGEEQMKNLKIGIAIAGILITMIVYGMFSGVFVSPQTLEAYKSDHERLEHSQSERMDAIVIAHGKDMEKVHNMSEDVAGIKATNEAILRELGNIRREMRQR